MRVAILILSYLARQWPETGGSDVISKMKVCVNYQRGRWWFCNLLLLKNCWFSSFFKIYIIPQFDMLCYIFESLMHRKKNFACEFSTLEWADLKTEILHDTTSPSYKPTLEVEHLALKRMFCCLFFMTSALFLILICHFFSVERI